MYDTTPLADHGVFYLFLPSVIYRVRALPFTVIGRGQFPCLWVIAWQIAHRMMTASVPSPGRGVVSTESHTPTRNSAHTCVGWTAGKYSRPAGSCGRFLSRMVYNTLGIHERR